LLTSPRRKEKSRLVSLALAAQASRFPRRN
jgi:hypothetical protein